MISIGNDIVALNTIDKQRTGEYRFYSKILSPAEQELYHLPNLAVIPFHIYVWLLWSAKESVYKYLKRQQHDLVFSPVQIAVDQISITQPCTSILPELAEDNNFLNYPFINLSIRYRDQHYYSKSVITADYIATFLTLDLERTYWGIKKINKSDPESQSDKVRHFVLKKLSSILTLGEIKIVKNIAGYPAIFYGKSELEIPLSFAHHGNYVSYAFCLGKY